MHRKDRRHKSNEVIRTIGPLHVGVTTPFEMVRRRNYPQASDRDKESTRDDKQRTPVEYFDLTLSAYKRPPAVCAPPCFAPGTVFYMTRSSWRISS